MKNIPLVLLFKNPTNIFMFVGFAFLFFDLNYWVMKNMLGTDKAQLQCLPGGALTTENILFALLLSLFMGIFIIGMKALFIKNTTKTKKASTLSIFSISGILGFFTVFCPVCTIGVISIFGVSFGLNFFLDYNFEIKVISLLLLFFGSYWINAQLKEKDCKICKIISKK